MCARLPGRLRAEREARGLTRYQVEMASGVSRVMVGRNETGRSVPTILVLVKVAQALVALCARCRRYKCLIYSTTAFRGGVLECAPMLLRISMNVPAPGMAGFAVGTAAFSGKWAFFSVGGTGPIRKFVWKGKREDKNG